MNYLFWKKCNLCRLIFNRKIKNYIDYVYEKKLGLESSEMKSRIPGLLKGKIWLSPDFDAPLEGFKDYM